MIKRIYTILLLLPILAVFFAFYSTSYVNAQSTITYPVVELGNCADVTACRAYCNLVEHRVACQAFAKLKGLVRPTPTRSVEVFISAQKDLGCSSAASCKEVCQVKENFAKCDAFAKKNRMGGGYDDSRKTALTTTFVETIQKKAGTVCTSRETCKEYCDMPENQQVCTDVSKQLGLKGGLERRGPGGCTTEASCKEYCSNPDNFDACSQYPGLRGNGQPSKFLGPGGCDSEQACRIFCDKNPERCERVKPTRTEPTKTVDSLSKNERIELRKLCKEPENKLPELLKDENSFKKICIGSPENFSDYAYYCKKNPTKCSSDGYKNFCTEFPARCGFADNELQRISPTERKAQKHVTTTPRLSRSPYPTRIITFVPYQMDFSTDEDTQSFSNDSEDTETFTPTRTPTRALEQTFVTATRVPSPTRIPSPTREPSPTRAPSPTSTSGSNSGSGSTTSGTSDNSGSGGSDDSTTDKITVTPQVRGVSTARSFFQAIYDFFFR
ncbi:MAG: hypothetical protein RI947_441 [Candidatus Parcubacteria bacterium]|jgi:hypothetical protein